MKPRMLEIARNGEILGVAPESEIPELLQIGFLQPTDSFRASDDDSWTPLSDLIKKGPGHPSNLLERVLPRARTLAATATDTARTVTKFVLLRKENAVNATAAALDAFTPQIKAAVARAAETSTFRAVKSGVRNDDFMRKLFGAAYDCLPKPVQRFVAEERFITFCMERRQTLMGPPTNPSTASTTPAPE